MSIISCTSPRPSETDLAGLERDQRAEIGLGGAQLLAEQAHEFAAPRRRSDEDARGDEAPAAAHPARAEPVKHRDGETGHQKQCRPAEEPGRNVQHPVHAKCRHRHRECDHRADGDDQEYDRAQGEGQAERIETDEAAALIAVFDHIERIDHRLDAGVGAPNRHGQTGGETKAQFGGPPGDAIDLFVNKIEPPGRQYIGKQIEVPPDGLRIRNQAIKRDERRYGGKNREQGVEHHASRHRHQAILVHGPIGLKTDPFPPGPGPRRGRPCG
jgi:hypothetical protein